MFAELKNILIYKDIEILMCEILTIEEIICGLYGYSAWKLEIVLESIRDIVAKPEYDDWLEIEGENVNLKRFMNKLVNAMNNKKIVVLNR